MRIVVDTNAFVSAALKANSLPVIVVRWVDWHGGLLKSTATELEVLDVLRRPHLAAVTIPLFRDGLAKMLADAELVMITERIAACRDPRDDKFLELAIRADVVMAFETSYFNLGEFSPRAIPFAAHRSLLVVR
jgi:uncharacterized protein